MPHSCFGTNTLILQYISNLLQFYLISFTVRVIGIGIFLGVILAQENQIFPNPLFNQATIEDFIDDDIFFEIVYPEELHYSYRLHQARNFGTSFVKQYKGVRLVVANPPECCSYPYNAESLKGAVALVSRGDCSFVSKSVKAEAAGALAVIVMDDDFENDDMYIKMIDDNTEREVGIPAFFLLGMSGHIIRRKLIDKGEEAAIINIPVNLSSVAIHKLNQPPWLIW